MVVWERTGAGWKVLEGKVGGANPAVVRARLIPFESGSETLLKEGSPQKAGEATLVVRSQRTVCREIELPVAADAEIYSMLELRLETELPYALSEATWSWQRQSESRQEGNTCVLSLAVPTADIMAQEQELRALGQPCNAVESHEAALAQVAAGLASGQETMAIAEVETGGVTLVVARNRELSYARYIGSGVDECVEPVSANAGASRLASEIRQSLQHYTSSKGASPPRKLLLVGQQENVARVAAELAQGPEPPIEIPHPPEWLHISEAAGEPREVFGRFCSCIGALVSVHRRLGNQETVAPSLRLPRTYLRTPVFCKGAALAVGGLLLAIVLIAVSFGVRSAKVRAANRVFQEVQPWLRGIELLEEEVNILETESDRYRPAVDLLLAIAETLPEGIAVSDLTIDVRNNVTILGKAPSVEVASQAEHALSVSEEFANAQLQRTTKENNEVVFRITCIVREKGGTSVR